MSLHRSISAPSDKNAKTRAYVLGLLACLAAYGTFYAACRVALHMGWYA